MGDGEIKGIKRYKRPVMSHGDKNYSIGDVVNDIVIMLFGD